MFTTLVLSHSGRVSQIALSRAPLNLLTVEMLGELHAAFDLVRTRAETRSVILTGSGARAFCAGADLNEEPQHPDGGGRRFRDAGRRMVEEIETFPKPIVAAIRGWCIGGGTGLAWACDIRIAGASAKFRAGDVYLGIIPTWSLGMVRLVHYIGRNRALDVLLLGEDIHAERAAELGLVSRVVPDDGVDAEARRVAERLANGAPLALRAIKEGVRCQYREGVDRAAELEEHWARLILSSHDAREGIQAFRDKRAPEFRGE